MHCKKHWIVPLVIVLGVTLIYFKAVGFGFVDLDDNIHVYENPRMNPVSFESIGSFWTSPYKKLYIPATYTAWSMETWLAKADLQSVLNPSIFHFFNLIFHITCGFLVYLLLLQVLRSIPGAFLGSLFFLFHPLQVETVSWVSGFKDLLATSFSLGAILLYFQSLKETCSPQKRYSLYLSSSLMFILALLSKPSAVILPIIIYVLAKYLEKSRQTSYQLSGLGFWLVPSLIIGIITSFLQTDQNPAFYVSFIQRFLVALDAICFYVQKLTVPFNLAVDYGRTPHTVLNLSQTSWLYLIPIAVMIYAWFKRKTHTLIWTSLLFLMVAIMPNMGIIPFRYQIVSTVADRYMYFPMIGAAMLFGAFVSRFEAKKPVIYACCLALIALGMASHFQNSIWKNSKTLFEAGLKINPRSWLLYNNFGSYYEKQKDWGKAVENYKKSAEIYPQAEPYNSIGAVYMMQNKLIEAEQAFRQGIKTDPKAAHVISNLGVIFAQTGRLEEAKEQFGKAIMIQPDFLPARNYLQKVDNMLKSKNKK